MATVFISYRREETAGEARALYNALTTRLGENAVFMDVDNIAPGRDFREALQERLASYDLLLALIGRDWANATNASGERRLEDPGDFVRLEIEAALKRKISVIPVLVQGAQMPAAPQLPDSIRGFGLATAMHSS
jgi:TIR domain-containing protein